jgi:hypothetical protein
MSKMPPDRDENKPFDYFRSDKSEQKEDTNINHILTSLRAGMLPATEEQPAKKSIFQQENLRIATGVMLGLVILAFIWYILIGPGRPEMEKNLASLAQRAETPTPTSTSSPIPPTDTPIPPSSTPTPTSTRKPTNTPLIGLNLLATSTTRFITPTSSSSCRQALSITLDDVGQSMCVEGIVIETADHPTDFMVIFSNEKNAFYWVSYDLIWSEAEVDTCYQIQGTIDRIGNSPVLVFSYQNLPEVCP